MPTQLRGGLVTLLCRIVVWEASNQTSPYCSSKVTTYNNEWYSLTLVQLAPWNRKKKLAALVSGRPDGSPASERPCLLMHWWGPPAPFPLLPAPARLLHARAGPGRAHSPVPTLPCFLAPLRLLRHSLPCAAPKQLQQAAVANGSNCNMHTTSIYF
jgi:hypothetical protein